MPPVCSFIRTVRYVLPRLVGLTQASRVMPVVRSRLLVSGMVAVALVPLKVRALPYLPLPVPVQVVLVRVPLLPVPDWSVMVVPVPVSRP